MGDPFGLGFRCSQKHKIGIIACSLALETQIVPVLKKHLNFCAVKEVVSLVVEPCWCVINCFF